MASLPFRKHTKYGFTVLSQPELTQKLGPTIRYPESQKYEKKLSFEKKILTDLYRKLPNSDRYVQNLDHSITNWLPMYWLGYSQTTQYTYVIDSLTDTDQIWSNFDNRTRTVIRKAEREVEVHTSDDVKSFHDINRMTFERQGVSIPYGVDFVERIDSACAERDCRRILVAMDSDQRIHAAIYLVWDEQAAYYVMGGSDPELRSSGAMHLLMWHAIQFSAGVTRTFDFEGSMIEPIEKFVRSFGALQKPYFCLSKTNSRMLKTLDFLRTL